MAEREARLELSSDDRRRVHRLGPLVEDGVDGTAVEVTKRLLLLSLGLGSIAVTIAVVVLTQFTRCPKLRRVAWERECGRFRRWRQALWALHGGVGGFCDELTVLVCQRSYSICGVPEIFACSAAAESRVGSHVRLRRPQRGGEGAGHAVPPASTTTDGGVERVALAAGGEGRHGGGGRRRLGVGDELRFHRLS